MQAAFLVRAASPTSSPGSAPPSWASACAAPTRPRPLPGGDAALLGRGADGPRRGRHRRRDHRDRRPLHPPPPWPGAPPARRGPRRRRARRDPRSRAHLDPGLPLRALRLRARDADPRPHRGHPRGPLPGPRPARQHRARRPARRRPGARALGARPRPPSSPRRPGPHTGPVGRDPDRRRAVDRAGARPPPPDRGLARRRRPSPRATSCTGSSRAGTRRGPPPSAWPTCRPRRRPPTPSCGATCAGRTSSAPSVGARLGRRAVAVAARRPPRGPRSTATGRCSGCGCSTRPRCSWRAATRSRTRSCSTSPTTPGSRPGGGGSTRTTASPPPSDPPVTPPT